MILEGLCLKMRSSRNRDQGTFVRCLQGSLILNAEMKGHQGCGISFGNSTVSSTLSNTNFCCQLSCSCNCLGCYIKELIQLEKKSFQFLAGTVPIFSPSLGPTSEVCQLGPAREMCQQGMRDSTRAGMNSEGWKCLSLQVD